MKEWKEIDFTDGLYSCSSDGEIKSNKSGKLLGGTLGHDGYQRIGLMMPYGKQKSFMWHRVVAHVWHPNPNNYGQVDHIDKQKLNNHPSNLEWVTQEENLKRRDARTVTVVSPTGEELQVVIVTTGQVDLTGWVIKGA